MLEDLDVHTHIQTDFLSVCGCECINLCAGWISKRPPLALHLMILQRASVAAGAFLCVCVCVCDSKPKRVLSFIRELKQRPSALRKGLSYCCPKRVAFTRRTTWATGWSSYTLKERCCMSKTDTHTLQEGLQCFTACFTFDYIQWHWSVGCCRVISVLF